MKTTNNLVNPLLTDLYQLTMAYGYWKNGRHEDHAVFDLFFRKNPFGGEFTIFAGLGEILGFLDTFRFSDNHINYLRSIMPHWEDEFFLWLEALDCSRIKIHAMAEGTVAFPREPLIRVEGPLATAQLLETTMLTLVNYPSLIATNAARFRIAAGENKTLIEFGLRRAQGPDGGISASRYSYMGGFDATSNVLAGNLFGIPVKGTHAHSFVQSYDSLDELRDPTILSADGKEADFVGLVLQVREEFGFTNTIEGELAAFIAYAKAFPSGFLALVDTYETLKSGVPNFLCVGEALYRLGYKPIGVRLDSGDLAYLSKETRAMFASATERTSHDFERCNIVASNDINEDVLVSLNHQEHEIDTFGIGTNLVTCQAQPALGCVFKLVEVNGNPRIKLSNEVIKITIPGKKEAFRLIGKEGYPLADILCQIGEAEPKEGDKVFCQHPFDETKRVYITPTEVTALHKCYWNGTLNYENPPLEDIRKYVLDQLHGFREDHLRQTNPTPYKVSVSHGLYNYVRDLWLKNAPIAEIG